jgi:DNA-binding YbaB/EbfC family protein
MNINPFDILKNAQKIQEQMGAFQEKLGTIIVTGTAGAGMVEVELNGRMEMVALRIAAEAVNPAEVEMLQDLIMAAFSNGVEKVKEALNREMGAFAGATIPGMNGFPGAGFSGLS